MFLAISHRGSVRRSMLSRVHRPGVLAPSPKPSRLAVQCKRSSSSVSPYFPNQAHKSIASRSGYQCQTRPGWPWEYTDSCKSPLASSTIAKVINGAITSTTSIPANPGGAVNAYGIEVRWQSTDTAILKLLTPGWTPTAIDTSSANPSVTSSATPSVTTPLQKGFTTGAKIGIGIAIPLVILGMLFGLLFCWRRHRQVHSGGSAHAGQDLKSQPQLGSGTCGYPLGSFQANPGPGLQFEPAELGVPQPDNHVGAMTTPFYATSPPQQLTPQTTAPPYAVGTHGNAADDEEALALQHEIDRVRQERESILRLQELNETERRLQQRLSERR